MHVFPPEARRVFLDEHAQLRTQLGALEEQLPRGGSTLADETLRKLARSFFEDLLEHMAHEERVLRPLLAHDAWGHQRVNVMDADHTAQRARVIELEKLLAGPVAEWRGAMHQFIEAVRADMVSEEKEALGA
jgi:iron-sulfur cluster repair protein YtfE (RIC family)